MLDPSFPRLPRWPLFLIGWAVFPSSPFPSHLTRPNAAWKGGREEGQERDGQNRRKKKRGRGRREENRWDYRGGFHRLIKKWQGFLGHFFAELEILCVLRTLFGFSSKYADLLGWRFLCYPPPPSSTLGERRLCSNRIPLFIESDGSLLCAAPPQPIPMMTKTRIIFSLTDTNYDTSHLPGK